MSKKRTRTQKIHAHHHDTFVYTPPTVDRSLIPVKASVKSVSRPTIALSVPTTYILKDLIKTLLISLCIIGFQIWIYWQWSV